MNRFDPQVLTSKGVDSDLDRTHVGPREKDPQGTLLGGYPRG